MIETQLERARRRGIISSNVLWIALFSGGVVLAVMFLNYLNKVWLVTYEVQGSAEFTFSSDQELKRFQERLAVKAKQENTRFIFKSTDGYIGSGLSSANPFKYQFQQFGYCIFGRALTQQTALNLINLDWFTMTIRSSVATIIEKLGGSSRQQSAS